MNTYPSFTHLYAVSDLHLGGQPPKGKAPPEGQIFDQGEAFADFVDGLLRRRKTEQQCLVINGDLVDFLAGPEATYFDAAQAGSRLEGIVRDPSFELVWRSLKDYVKARSKRLVITLGNHDLELYLPWVRELLLQELAGGDAEARERITLAFDEDGFRCRVGGADVLCVHGNDVDAWNWTDWKALRRQGESGGADAGWVPNAGSKLVIEVMKAVKQKYPFVDLLKPETEAVLPALLVLDPGQVVRVADALPSVLRLGWDRLRKATGFLSEAEAQALASGSGGTPSVMLRAMLGGALGAEALPRRDVHGLEALLVLTEERWRRGLTPAELLAQPDRADMLGYPEALASLVQRKGRAEVLRQALEGLKTDPSFDWTAADAACQALDGRIGRDIDFLVTGHTHLERALPLRGENRFYFNSGAWARLMRLDEKVLGDPAVFGRAYQAMEKGSLQDLDELHDPKVVIRRPSVVALWADDKGTHGELRVMNRSKLESRSETHKGPVR